MCVYKKISLIVFLIFLFHHGLALADKHVIKNYQPIFVPAYTKTDGSLRIAIRTYYLDELPYYLVVNPYTFATEAGPIANFDARKMIAGSPGYYAMQELMATPYMQALSRYTAPPYLLQNQGIRHAEKPVDGAFLTIDLCPSIKPFEKEFFALLANIADNPQKPVSIAISVTGLWMISHPDEFNWLVQQMNENKLQITWTSHGFSHTYYPDLPLDKNFLLEPHTNIKHEILATEVLLLEQGQLPSVFFRFPGLVSSEKLILKLGKYGLIPLGTDAWLAKNFMFDIGVWFQQETPKGKHVWFGFSMIVKDSAPFDVKDITTWLKNNRVESRPIIAGNMTRHPGVKMFPHRISDNLDTADRVMKNGFSFGCHQGTDLQACQYILDVIDAFIKEKVEGKAA